MTRPSFALMAGAAILVLGACSGDADKSAPPGATSTRDTTQGPTPTARSRPEVKLRVPSTIAGEISRTVLRPGHVNTTTVREKRPGDRTYRVEAACSGKGAATILTYVLLDARDSSAAKAQEERTISSGEVTCDGVTVTANSTGPLPDGPVTVSFVTVPEQVSVAYAVVVPE